MRSVLRKLMIDGGENFHLKFSEMFSTQFLTKSVQIRVQPGQIIERFDQSDRIDRRILQREKESVRSEGIEGETNGNLCGQMKRGDGEKIFFAKKFFFEQFDLMTNLRQIIVDGRSGFDHRIEQKFVE